MNSKFISNDENVANCFNNYFVSVFGTKSELDFDIIPGYPINVSSD